MVQPIYYRVDQLENQSAKLTAEMTDANQAVKAVVDDFNQQIKTLAANMNNTVQAVHQVTEDVATLRKKLEAKTGDETKVTDEEGFIMPSDPKVLAALAYLDCLLGRQSNFTEFDMAMFLNFNKALLLRKSRLSSE